MSTWLKISTICVFLIAFQFLLPFEGVGFLGLGEVTVGTVTKEEEVIDSGNLKQSIYFVGDVMLARDVERRMGLNGPDFPFASFTIPSTSYAFLNFESAVPDIHVPTPNNTFRFSTDKRSLIAVKSAGFTHAGLANNHTFDFGLSGYNQTVSNLWEEGLVPFGHPSVVSLPSYTIVEVGNTTVGVIALHTLYGNPTSDSVSAVLETMKNESDIQIAYVHWGEEYTHIPSASQRNFANDLAELGVDIIVGHHPHVVQSIEMVQNTLVFYSLGNFIFDQYFSDAVQQGLVLDMRFDSVQQLVLIPVSSQVVRIQPAQMDAQNKATFLEFLASISAPELQDSIRQGAISLDELLAITPEVVIMTE